MEPTMHKINNVMSESERMHHCSPFTHISSRATRARLMGRPPPQPQEDARITSVSVPRVRTEAIRVNNLPSVGMVKCLDGTMSWYSFLLFACLHRSCGSILPGDAQWSRPTAAYPYG